MKKDTIFERLFSDPTFDRLNNLHRWNGIRRLKEESVAHHSYIVTLFARILAETTLVSNDDRLMVTTRAIFHDWDEIFSGDITHDVKYNDYNGKEIRDAVDAFVRNSMKAKFSEDNGSFSEMLIMGYSVGKLPKYVDSLVKVSDWLSMAFYLKMEVTLGNRSLDRLFRYCDEHINRTCKQAKEDLAAYCSDGFSVSLLDEIIDTKFSIDG
jgi:5'-deoxynucleotidase YfbR-like HD superfamily hydrolase